MAKRVGCGTPCLLYYKVWVSTPAGILVIRVFHPARKLVRLSLLKCPIPNSKFGSPHGEVEVADHLRLPLYELITMRIPASYYYY